MNSIKRSVFMRLLKALPIIFIVLFVSNLAHAQFWFGPRVGMHFTDYKYLNDVNALFPIDSLEYDIETSSNFNFGLAFEYTTEGSFSIHTEIVYQKVDNTVKSKAGNPVLLSKSTYDFIHVPFMFRMNFGGAPLKFYVNAGPRVSYWLGGKGTVQADELIEFGVEEGRSYEIHFGSPTQDLVSQGDFFFVPKANRIQYAFELGTGVMYGLNEGMRAYVDVRYTFGHSNMGFNDQADFGLVDYTENIEYTHRMFSFSVGFLFGYDPNNKRKGASNSRVGK